nr:HAD family phosphatase [uncultured Clostridium sp.]
MIKAVIFDLDGLLIDSEVISYQLYQELLNKYGYSFTIEDYAQNYSGKTELGNMEAIVKNYQLPVSIKEGLDYTLSREKEYFIKGVSLKSGVRELLDYLKKNKYKIALASSSTKERALYALIQQGIESYFDEMVFGTEVEKGKPNPDIFLKACEKVKVDPENCLVLEDSEAGIQASFSAGIPVICVPDMKKPTLKFQKMTEIILPSLLEVLFYLDKKTMTETVN